jgi:arylamine N-acetyltransferase
MEDSLLMTQVLRGFGFSVYPVGVRIRLRHHNVPSGDYVGWVHIVNLVTLADGSRWMVDVGFGGDGATKPIPLVEGTITRNLGSQDIRLMRDFVPGQTDRSSPEKKLWIYQYRNGSEMEWNSYYAFPDLEFLSPDYTVMNWWTSTSPESFQTFTVLITLFLRRPNSEVPGHEEIYGKRMLVNGTVKENLGGRTKIVRECTSEEERVEALREFFGIVLTQEERHAIRGKKVDLDRVPRR